LVIVEAAARLIPGVLGNSESFIDDSFALGEMAALIEGPVYTRPPVWRELAVPEILLSGDHEKIANWRLAQARNKTAEIRPDLVD
jgi:tRNA (guanine37-N1)-methyltransferase